MEKFARFISVHHRLVLIVGILLAIPAGIATVRAPINFDIFSYLPDSVEAIKGQLIMKDEFKTAETAFAMLNTTDPAKVLMIKEDLAKIEGVENVTWISDLVDPSVPDTFVPPELLTMFKKGQHSLLTITFANAAVTEETQNAIAAIEHYLGDDKPFTGMPVFVYELKQLVEQQKVRSIIAAVTISTAMIAIAIGSITGALIMLATVGIGIFFNLSTNFIQGEISYITAAVAAVIQLGVTFDFSIFLMQRFREERQHTDDKVEAMTHAIMKAFSAILPAGLCTMTGFLALAIMKVRIGADMGIVMSKGIFCGVLVALTVLPAMTLTFDRFMKVRHVGETAHHHAGMARWITEHSTLMMLLFVAIFIPATIIRMKVDISYNINDMLPQNIKAMQAIGKIETNMGSVEMADILFPDSTPRFLQAQILDEIAKLDSVDKTISLAQLADPAIPESFIPAEAAEQFEKGGYSRAIARLNIKPGTAEGNQCISDIRSIIKKHDIQDSIVTGTAAVSKDLVDASSPDLKKVDLLAIVLIFLIVALSYVSFAIPVLLVAAIMLAIFINLGIPFLFGHAVPFLTITAITAIQLGCCVDYAILLMSRYKQERRKASAHDAMVETVAGASPAIIISALSLFTSTFGLVFISDVDTVQSLALLIGRGALISMVIIVVMLPAVIVKADKFIGLTTRNWKKNAFKESLN